MGRNSVLSTFYCPVLKMLTFHLLFDNFDNSFLETYLRFETNLVVFSKIGFKDILIAYKSLLTLFWHHYNNQMKIGPKLYYLMKVVK